MANIVAHLVVGSLLSRVDVESDGPNDSRGRGPARLHVVAHGDHKKNSGTLDIKRFRPKRYLDLWLIGFCSALASILALSNAPAPLALPFAIVAALFAPGYSLILAVEPTAFRKGPQRKLLLLAPAASVVMTVVVTYVAFSLANHVSARLAISAVLVTTISMLVVAGYRRPRA